jgi:hypothetical protein
MRAFFGVVRWVKPPFNMLRKMAVKKWGVDQVFAEKREVGKVVFSVRWGWTSAFFGVGLFLLTACAGATNLGRDVRSMQSIEYFLGPRQKHYFLLI